METVFCECKKCGNPIGRFANLWTKIGKSYFSPVVEPEDALAIQCHGAIRIGEGGTLVQECHLQDIVCTSCTALLGLRCVRTPVNHVLDESQVLLRLASVEFLGSDGREVEFAIKRVLNVGEPSRVSAAPSPQPPRGQDFTSAFPGYAELQKLQVEFQTQKEDIRRIDNHGFRIVSALDKRASRTDGEVLKLTLTIDEVHRDVGAIQREVGSIKTNLAEIKGSSRDAAALSRLDNKLTRLVDAVGDMEEQLTAVKSQLSQQKLESNDMRLTVQSCVSTADHAQDMAALHAQIAQLRQQPEEASSRGMGRLGTAFPTRELEVITSNIAKIGSRASQVESLQMELEILKGRVDRIEERRQAVGGGWPTRSSRPGGLPAYSDTPSVVRKRPASPSLDPRTKRPASTLSHSNFANRSHGRHPPGQANPPSTLGREDPENTNSSRTPDSTTRGRSPAVSCWSRHI